MVGVKRRNVKQDGDLGPGESKYKMGWNVKFQSNKPSRHDHVGHMLFSDSTAVCTAPECEQAWDFDKKQGWIPIIGGKPLRKQWDKKAAPTSKNKVARLAEPEEAMTGAERDIFERINKGLKEKRG